MRKLLAFLISLIALQSSGQIFRERIFHEPGSELLTYSRIKDKSMNMIYLTGSPVYTNSFLLKTDLDFNFIDSTYINFDHGKEGGLQSMIIEGDSIITTTTRFDDFYGNYYKNELIIFDTSLNVLKRLVFPIDSIPIWRATYLKGGKLLLQGGSHSSPPNLYLGVCNLDGVMEMDTVYKEFYDVPWLSNWVSLDNGTLLSFSGFKFRLELDPTSLVLSVADTSVQNTKGKILEHPNGYFYHTASFLSLAFGKVRDGAFVRKIDSNGLVVDSISIYNDRDNPVNYIFDASCTLNNGSILMAYVQDSTLPGTNFKHEKLVVACFDEQLNLLWKKESPQNFLTITPYTAVATPDGGAIIMRKITDTVNYMPGKGDVYYLRIDSTGYFSPLSAKEFDGMVSVAKTIYPNPVSTAFTVDGLVENESYQAGIYDLTGNLKKRLELFSSSTVNVSELEKGAYLLILQDERGLRTTRKFVKE